MSEYLLNLVERIYANVGREEGWADSLSACAEAVGARSGCLVSESESDPKSNVDCYHNIDPEWIAAYNEYYHQFDPTLETFVVHPGEARPDHVTGPLLSELNGDREIFYNEVMRPQSFRHTLALGFSSREGWNAGIVLQRPESAGPFHTGDIQILGRLGIHLRQALWLHSRLQNSRKVQHGLAAALEASPVPVVLLNGRGQVIFANERAERLLAATRIVSLEGRLLKARDSRDQVRLQRLIQQALNCASGADATMPGGRIWLQRHLHINVTPVVAAGEEPFRRGQRFAAVWLSARGTDRKLSPARLQRYYRLTPVEAELASLLTRGRSPTEIARIRGVSSATVRTQIKSIKSKVGVSRHAELVHVLMVGPAAQDFSG